MKKYKGELPVPLQTYELETPDGRKCRIQWVDYAGQRWVSRANVMNLCRLSTQAGSGLKGVNQDGALTIPVPSSPLDLVMWNEKMLREAAEPKANARRQLERRTLIPRLLKELYPEAVEKPYREPVQEILPGFEVDTTVTERRLLQRVTDWLDKLEPALSERITQRILRKLKEAGVV